MKILALDVGSLQTGWVLVDTKNTLAGVELLAHGIDTNEAVNGRVFDCAMHGEAQILALESPQPRNQPTSSHEMDMLVWMGRFVECWAFHGTRPNQRWTLVPRELVKRHLCGTKRRGNRFAGAHNDAAVREAICNRFGGAQLAIGNKRCRMCKGKGWRTQARIPCEQCAANPGWDLPPGPLADIRSHEWAALGVAMTLRDRKKLLHRITKER